MLYIISRYPLIEFFWPSKPFDKYVGNTSYIFSSKIFVIGIKFEHSFICCWWLKRYAKFNQIKANKNKKPSKFTLGQFVKVFAKKNIFSRGFNQNVTKEYFQIYHIDRNLSKDRYYLKDLAGDKILGSFYKEYLVPFSPPADGGEFKLDPDHKDFRRKKIRGIPHIFVKWKGWPKKFNQWVKETDIRRFI